MNPYDDLQTYLWPASRLGEAVEALAQKSGFLAEEIDLSYEPPELIEHNGQAMTRWLEQVTGWLGLEAIAVTIPYVEIETFVQSAGPSLLYLPDISDGSTVKQAKEELCFLALLKGERGLVTVIKPNLAVGWLKPLVIQTALNYPLEVSFLDEVEKLLLKLDIPLDRQPQARTTLLQERLKQTQVHAGWRLRLSPGAKLWPQLRQANLIPHLLLALGSYGFDRVLLFLAWWFIGSAVLEGRFDVGWSLIWALIMLARMPFWLLRIWLEKRFAVGAGSILKRRLLYGALQLKAAEVQAKGRGHFLGQVIESEVVAESGLSKISLALSAMLDLVILAVVLALGTGGLVHTLLLLSWLFLSGLISWSYFRRYHLQYNQYLKMTNDLFEQMVGHQTRLVQEDHKQWHNEEDLTLDGYLSLSKQKDKVESWLLVFIPVGWLIISLLGLAYPFIFATVSSTALVITLLAILLTYETFTVLVWGLRELVEAIASWQQVAPLSQIASERLFKHSESAPKNETVFSTKISSQATTAVPERKQLILSGRNLFFRYQAQSQPILQGCNFRIYAGDRLLLTGPPGGGKSTLASLLSGLYTPEAGMLLFEGLDLQSVGSKKWRQQIVLAPQFHQNYILDGTLAFNLLMGQRWPPLPQDLAEAEVICRELGLGDLLDQMPAGLQQEVGEGGWQLSHGEQSRLHTARSLLQPAKLIILDESFASLDPENLYRALHCVLKRAPTLLVIA